MKREDSGSPWLAVALLSAAALGYEILLTRLFAIVYWDHLAHMVISLALLGYGASGTFLSLAGPRLREHFAPAFTTHIVLFSILAPLCFALAQALPFNPLELAWEPANWLWFGALYLLLSLPFFVAANAIALALWQSPDRVHGVYAADLAGAGIGAIGIIVLLYVVTPGRALQIIIALGVLCVPLASWQIRRHRKTALLFASAGLLFLWLLPTDVFNPQASQFKALPQSLAMAGAEIIAKRSSPLSQITVVRNDQVPFRLAPGMSLIQGHLPPRQLGLFQDAELAGPVTYGTHTESDRDYLDAMPSALPYYLLSSEVAQNPLVFLAGSGTGEGVSQAQRFGAAVELAEQDAALLGILTRDLADWSGRRFDDVTLHPMAPRAFSPVADKGFDLVQIMAPGIDSAGLRSLGISHDLTLDAFEQFFGSLSPGGIMAITHPLQAPPRAVPRLIQTAIDTLRAAQLSPARHLVVIRAFRTATVILSRQALTAEQVSVVREFSRERGFDLVYLPGIEVTDTNRYNLLPKPVLYELTTAMLNGEADELIAAYPFRIESVDDDRPFFYHGFRWSSLASLWQQGVAGSAAHLEWGYLILLATLIQALALSLMLILWPALASARGSGNRSSRLGVLLYFGGVGIAFMFVEIAFIHALQRLLHDPVIAVSAVLASFLVFAGIGSRVAPGLSHAISRRWDLSTPWPLFIGIGIAASIALVLLPAFSEHLSHWQLWARYSLAVLLVAPLAVLMGMPFPLGLALVTRRSPDRLPLAWAVNGCLSVVGAVAAQMTALALGFNATIMLGVLIYLLTAVAMPRLAAPDR